MGPQRLAQIRERIRQGRVFVGDSRQLLEEIDRLTATTYWWQLASVVSEPERQGMSEHEHREYVDIVFDGPPAHESGRFVEAEDQQQASLSIGRWVHREDGYWVLRMPVPAVTAGVEWINIERKRQIEVKGYTVEHDATHEPSGFVAAAACYASVARQQLDGEGWGEDGEATYPRSLWPRNWGEFKPEDDPKDNLRKAGALIAAAIDRVET